jgi:uncharacterized BrkB/YihY/UPF0761 family membrane protein
MTWTRGWRISGWRWETFAKHLWTKINTDDVLNRAAILSFYFLLALFPLLLFLTALLGYFADPSMKPGRVKDNSGCDRFTLLFEFPQLTSKWLKFVVSFNGATSSHSRTRVLLSGSARVSRHLNQFPNLPCPT